MKKPTHLVHLCCLLIFTYFYPADCNLDAKRLYDDLFTNYNPLVRPVHNDSQPVKVQIKLKLSQLIEVNLKDQIMTTSTWVEHRWFDQNLRWSPENYNGIKSIHLESDKIWRPDIVLYNNAAADFEVVLATKAKLNYKGEIFWSPPAIYKSSCEIDVEWFPFDEQNCRMKFGSWTYDGFKVDLRHLDEKPDSAEVELGIDLSDFHLSVEWDIVEVPARRNTKFYLCCESPYLDLTFNISMRRKTLFYTVNLILPCAGISFLTVLVFYLPSDSGEKMSLSVSILVALTVFFILLAETIPPTSLTIPFLGKYLLFTMLLVGLSICVTVIVLNIHFRSASTHHMSNWMRLVFLQILPKLLCMKRPNYQFANCKYLDPNNYHDQSANYVNVDSIDHNNIHEKEEDLDGQKIPEHFFSTNEPICKRKSSTIETRSMDAYNEQERGEDKEDKKNSSKIYSIGCEINMNKENPGRTTIQRQTSINTTRQSSVSNAFKLLTRNDRIVPLSNYSLNSIHSVGVYQEKDPFEKKILNSFSSIQSLPDDESSKDEMTNNDPNNNFFHNNQLGNQLDYRLVEDSNSELNRLYNESNAQHCPQQNTIKSIRQSIDDECSLNSPIKYIVESNKLHSHCSKYQSTNSAQCPSLQQVKRQYSDSFIPRNNRMLKHENHFNKSLDQMLLNRSMINQNGRLKATQHSFPVHQQQPDPSSSSISVKQFDRSSIRRNIDQNIFQEALYRIERNPHIKRAMSNVYFLAEHTRKSVQEEEIREDYKFVALVLDRLFLWIFLIAVVFGSLSIILLDEKHPNNNKLTQLTSSLLNKSNLVVQRMWSGD